MLIPSEAVEKVRGIFRQANQAATKSLSENPNLWETALDMSIITTLNKYHEPIMATRDCLINIQTHFLGSRRLYGNWEIADIGLLVMFRIKGKLIRSKLALLQSKRLYPKEISGVQEDELHHYMAGFSRLYQEQEDYLADTQQRTFAWNWDSEYKAIKKGDEQEQAIIKYEKESRIPVYYLLYNPYKMGWKFSVPVWGPSRSATYSLGTRIVSSAEMRRASASLEKDQSPSADAIRQIRHKYFKGNDKLGLRLEDFIADRILGCHEGYIADDPQDIALERVFFNRSGPITSAIAITVDLLDG